MAKITQRKVKGKVDENGEVSEFEYTNTFNVGEEPPYVKLYYHDIMYMRGVPYRCYGVLYALIKRMSYAGDEYGMCVTVTKGIKEAICKEIEWKNPAQVDNCIQELLKGKIVRRVARGIYQFNPILFGRGNWADVAKLRLTVEYDEIHGRVFSSNPEINMSKEEREYWEEVNRET